MIRRILLTAVMPFLTVCFISAQNLGNSYESFEKEQAYKYEEYKNYEECQKEYFAYLREESLADLYALSPMSSEGRKFKDGDIRNVGNPIPRDVISLFYVCLVCEPLAKIESAEINMQTALDNMKAIYIGK